MVVDSCDVNEEDIFYVGEVIDELLFGFVFIGKLIVCDNVD